MAGEKIKIAYFADILTENFDGVTRTLYNYAAHVPQDRFEILFISAAPPAPEAKFPFPVYKIPSWRFLFYKAYPWALPSADPKLGEVLDNFRPDIIHFVAPFTLGNYALNYGKKRKVPVVATYHTHYPSYVQYYAWRVYPVAWLISKGISLFFRRVYNRCQRVYVPTSVIRDELLEYGIYPEKMKVWGRGVDLDVFNPDKADRKRIADTMGSRDSFNLLFAGRLVQEKEIATLMRLYKRFAQSKYKDKVRFLIAGDGPFKQLMQRKMPTAVFLGHLTPAQLAVYYASSDAFVFPSTTETFGNSVLEAMACGLVPVVAAQGGPKGIVQDGITGLHAVPRSAEDFFEKVAGLIEHPQLRLKLAQNAVAYAQSQKWSALVTDMLADYRSIIEAGPEKHN